MSWFAHASAPARIDRRPQDPDRAPIAEPARRGRSRRARAEASACHCRYAKNSTRSPRAPARTRRQPARQGRASSGGHAASPACAWSCAPQMLAQRLKIAKRCSASPLSAPKLAESFAPTFRRAAAARMERAVDRFQHAALQRSRPRDSPPAPRRARGRSSASERRGLPSALVASSLNGEILDRLDVEIERIDEIAARRASRG